MVKKNKALNKIKDTLPGFIVAVSIALISMGLSKFAPSLGAGTIAIFLGMILGNLFLGKKVFQTGYKFSETNLLSYSIVLLGGTLSVTKLMQLGFNGILFIVIQMTVTIVGVMFIGKKLGFSQNFRMLMATGNAVCGSSAIAATSPVIDASDNDKGIAITVVNITGIFLMFLIPVICGYLYNHETVKTSAMIGGTLQSVGQVVASGKMVNEHIKELATIFKIVRIIFLVVVVFVLGHIKQKSNNEISKEEMSDAKSSKIKIPWYVIGFFITCALFTFKIISPEISNTFKFISNKFEIVALAAIGLRVNLRELIRQGKAMSLYALFVGLLQIITAILLISILL